MPGVKISLFKSFGNTLLQIPKRDNERIWSSFFADNLLAGTTNHHILAEVFHTKHLANVSITGFELNKERICLHLLKGCELPFNDLLRTLISVE